MALGWSLLLHAEAWLWEGWDHRRLWVPRWQWPHITAAPAVRENVYDAGIAVWILVVYRFIAFGYAFGFGVWEWARGGYDPLIVFPSFLTYDTMWFITVYFFFINIIGLGVLFGAREVDTATRQHPWVAWMWWQTCRAAQALHSISVAFALVVVLLFWLLIFSSESDPFQLYRDYSQHGIYCGLLTIDVLLGSNVAPDRQSIIAFFAGCVYLLYNLGYTKTRGPVYSILTWSDGWSAIISLGSLAAMQLVYFGYAGLCAGRDMLWLRAAGTMYDGLQHAPRKVASEKSYRIGLSSFETYFPFFFDASTVSPCATCCKCCIVPDPFTELEQISIDHPPETGHTKAVPTVTAV